MQVKVINFDQRRNPKNQEVVKNIQEAGNGFKKQF
jgi:hypothetical protein